ncbi:hypothetical protein P0F07_003045 [Vibrio metschnikovii]|uniref:hypothetical protein n=1 Tax=Vibrio sp. V33_P6A3T137 TaxID=1938685 RepID=UPI001372C765|nr:hypothetical protein [Vibrio sp. V33_P6A3T137]EKO3688211.1 hypothetical protein [Vibrio metschnikovii]EKO3691609.1 hypothetical protein [Vibrio metschnikovii]NAW78223.1 hypothetical protein [Vibrio sp. V33_P6A3T137]
MRTSLIITGIFGVILVSMWIQLKAQRAEIIMLSERAAIARANFHVQRTINQQISDDRERMSQLLTERAQRNAQEKESLRNEITQLRDEMAGSRCVVPPTVTERLREPY